MIAAEIIHHKHFYIILKEVIKMLEYDEYRLALQAMEKSINDLRDSL